MAQHAPFKYAWRLARYDDQTFESMVRQFEHHPSVCDEVWFFVHEPSSYGYHPLEDVAKQCAVLKPRMDRMRAMGIRAGINVWPTFGDNGLMETDSLPPMPYPCMVDKNGVKARAVACPGSTAFLEYIRQKFKVIAQTGPDFIWVDDDCRMMDLNADFPCFCPDCVTGFQNGRWTSREELVAALNTPENTDLRYAWSDYMAGKLETFCRVVRAAVDEVDPTIETPLMSVGYSHTTYCGNYLQRCAAALRAREFRPGHGFYYDDSPRELFHKTMDMARQAQRMPAGSDILMEEESYPMTMLDKACATRMLEVSACLGAGCNGVAFNHLLKCGGKEPLDYLTEELCMMQQHRPMFERYVDFAADLPCAGIWPIDNEWKLAGMPVDETGWFDEYKKGYEVNTADRWLTYGIAQTVNPAAAYANLLHGRMVETMRDEEIKPLFEKPVVMDHEALSALHRRGFGYLAGATVGEKHRGVYETLTDHPANGGYSGGHRMPLGVYSANLYPMEGWHAEILAENTDAYDNYMGLGALRLTKEGHQPVVILGCGPYRFIGTPGKFMQLQNLLQDMGAPLVIRPVGNRYAPGRPTPFIRTNGKRAAIVLINASIDTAKQLEVQIKIPGNKVVLLQAGKPDVTMPVTRKGEYAVVVIDSIAPWDKLMLLAE